METDSLLGGIVNADPQDYSSLPGAGRERPPGGGASGSEDGDAGEWRVFRSD